MTASKPQHDCPCCTCGLDEYTWSDRTQWVAATDRDGLADMVVGCALDHSYDRGVGVPYGFSDAMHARLAAVVEKHLSAVQPDWLNRSVTMTAAQKAALRAEVRAVFDSVPPEEIT